MWSGAAVCASREPRIWYNVQQKETMGLVKTRRLAAMQKQQRAKAVIKPPVLVSPVHVASSVRALGKVKVLLLEGFS